MPIRYRRSREAFDTAPGFSHRSPNFGVFPSGGGFLALRPFVDALQSLALTMRSRTLRYVRTPLSIVTRLLAIICDSVPPIGDAISFVSDQRAADSPP